MSCKASIDDVQQSAQTAENEYDIHVVNRAQELDQRFAKKRISFEIPHFLIDRWEHSVASIFQRIQSLQESVKNAESDIYSSSVEYPWQRAIALNKIPYYIK